tara:strand:- start:405 stop:632 length:228 start_codon:yes stop_codon:yes gene_type:complete
MFIARAETRNFDFMAAGNTAEQALDALRCGWIRHAEATGATIPVDEIIEDAWVGEINPGMCIFERDFVLCDQGGE